jgi:hypothetical protein
MTNRTGIKTLADIRERCVEVGECWEWQGSFSGCGQPRHRLDGKQRKVCHTAFALAGKTWPEGKYLVRKCGNLACVNPAHLEPMTRSEQMKLAASMGKCSRPDQTAARTNGNRARSKYSMELANKVRAMRSENFTLANISEALGVPVDVASKMARGVMWAPTASGASVFDWRPA